MLSNKGSLRTLSKDYGIVLKDLHKAHKGLSSIHSRAMKALKSFKNVPRAIKMFEHSEDMGIQET